MKKFFRTDDFGAGCFAVTAVGVVSVGLIYLLLL
jgi:hypothetical protein